VCISGDDDAPNGEYRKGSTTPACGNAKDGWKGKITQGGAKFDYKNKTGIAPCKSGAPNCTVDDNTDGTCTGDAEGVRKIKLKDLGNGTWKYKIDIRNMDLDAQPANDGSKVLGRLQLQLAFANCLGGAPTTAGTDGHCLDLQFDEGSCKVKTGFGGLRKVVCK